MTDSGSDPIRTEPRSTLSPVAVIDIGSSSIRMAIAEFNEQNEIRILDRLSRAVRLGKDTFTGGTLRRRTIEESVEVLKSYRRVLNEYQIHTNDQIRCVATSAVREASNRLQFVDRIYSATGLKVKTIDEAEISRVTYLGLAPKLRKEPLLDDAATIIAEVGGGGTAVLVVHRGSVIHSHNYRLGSVRLRQTLEAYETPRMRMRSIMESQIDRTAESIKREVEHFERTELIALGGDIRFAAAQLISDRDPHELASLSVKKLQRFTDSMLAMSDDELISRHRLSVADAETLGPALLMYARIASSFGMKKLRVSDFNLRDALLNEIRIGGVWSPEFTQQVLQSAVGLGHRYHFDERHGLHVAALCSVIVDALESEHALSNRDQMLLQTAAILHEIGSFISNRGHHKHSMYLINNSELFGLSPSEIRRVGMVARYHRRASPRATHENYMQLDQSGRIAVAQMAAILRVADSLDGSRSQRIRDIECHCEGDRFVISVPHVDDLSLEQLVLRQKGAFFESTFGMRVQLRKKR